MQTETRALPFASLNGLSDKSLAIHHDKLYAGYVAKKNEITNKLTALMQGDDVSSANQTYSELRALKDGETFAVNGVYLHEGYFDILGGDGQPSGSLVEALAKQFGKFENFQTYFTACGLAARGWVVLCWDMHEQELKIYTADAHNQGGIWGCLPLLILDVYEHAYFLDYGSDRAAYIASWWKNLNWKILNEKYNQTRTPNPSVLLDISPS